jgi:hypothetical protein
VKRLDKETIAKLQSHYSYVHPLLFQRSVEKARSPGDLFDILDTIPSKFPITWDDSQRRWVISDDMLQAKSFVNRKN